MCSSSPPHRTRQCRPTARLRVHSPLSPPPSLSPRADLKVGKDGSDGGASSPAKAPPTSDSTGRRAWLRRRHADEEHPHELSEERGTEELSSATNGSAVRSRSARGGFGSVYNAFFHSASGGRVFLAVKPQAPQQAPPEDFGSMGRDSNADINLRTC
ncbi:hypothetical protein EJB05_12301 [Eragrostis curvula]|uniref:Uncharacterized protein n=1 Tax=Eragrostis curvula TaxID=38414 RepID=A0A5J9VTM1_9POAL|nr:hypothetical protein EJB05_12301 [Eragrostis curvula]